MSLLRNSEKPGTSKEDDSDLNEPPKKQPRVRRQAKADKGNKRKDLAKALGRKPNFPVAKIHEQLNQGKFRGEIPAEIPIYLAAVEEYIAAEILELAGNVAKSRGENEIKQGDLVAAICQDTDLRKALEDCISY